MDQHTTGLACLEDIKPIYLLPDDPFVSQVLIPCFQSSCAVDCMVGFFTSGVLVSLAPGLATFINESQGVFRLVISPIVRAEDWAAIETGVSGADEITVSIFDDVLITEDALQHHTLECLSWLLRQERLEIQIALMRDGLFHPKVWLFHDQQGQILCAHGSTNLTASGMHRNVEQVAVCASWGDSRDNYTIQRLDQQFQTFWDHESANCIVLPLPEVVRERLVNTYTSKEPPQELDPAQLYRRAVELVSKDDTSVVLPPRPSFQVPSWLEYRQGPFAHQGEAVDAWCNAGFHGVLEMATGAGKTIAAMIAAYRLFEIHKPLLIVVAAPYLPLVQQWCSEIEPFGIAPIDLTSVSGPKGRGSTLGRVNRRLQMGIEEVVAIVVTHDILTNVSFQEELERFNATILLIGDEVHGLGSESFIGHPPERVEYRLGLSATPERQYDDEGTRALFDYFGPVVYQFPLEKAVGTCLVPYDYFVHPVSLNEGEMFRWHELTQKIRQNSWRNDDEPNAFLPKLFRDRRAILENAASKVGALKEILQSVNASTLKHTLIYASDKDPEQLERVNQTLRDLGVRYHQLTYEETGNRKKTQEILRSFQEGHLQVLTAKRVLDEGVNIPEIQKAFILASTTVERQWVQRRGRLLRKCSETNKTHSEIHDFVVLPEEEGLDSGTRHMVESELVRIREFAGLARNSGRPGGPLDAIRQLMRISSL